MLAQACDNAPPTKAMHRPRFKAAYRSSEFTLLRGFAVNIDPARASTKAKVVKRRIPANLRIGTWLALFDVLLQG